MVTEIRPLYTEVEAAKILRVLPRSLRSERLAGRITFRRVAGKIMYRADDLAAWQERISVPASDGAALPQPARRHRPTVPAKSEEQAIARALVIKKMLLGNGRADTE